MARLSHPTVVAVFDAEDGPENLFLVMEYLPGMDLFRAVGDRGPMPVPVACGYLRQAALGLAHAHAQGVIKRATSS